MVLPLSKGGNVLGFWLLISGGWCSLSPKRPKLGDNGGAHCTSPVKPIGDNRQLECLIYANGLSLDGFPGEPQHYFNIKQLY